jgi:beta-lactamase class A
VIRAAAACGFTVCSLVQAAPDADWVGKLQADLAHVDAQGKAHIGVYVRDLETGASASYKADETWYLASTIKLPVALLVLSGIQQGAYTLETPLALRASDYVDGAGPTASHLVGTPLTIRYLLDQMMIYSDNTASDMLIGLVGIRNVNSLVQSLVPTGFQPITTLADVRRHVYAQLTPAAIRLSGHDFILLKQQRSDLDKRLVLSRLLQVPARDFKLRTVAEAFDAYYATGLNSARLDAYGQLIELFVTGHVLDASRTAYLLELMERVKTGPNRIRAGLPPDVRWAHKTGTQSARTCDSGVITVPRFGRDRQVVVAACTRGDLSVTGSDRALRQVGAAICRSGVLGARVASHEPNCFADAAYVPRPDPDVLPDVVADEAADPRPAAAAAAGGGHGVGTGGARH